MAVKFDMMHKSLNQNLNVETGSLRLKPDVFQCFHCDEKFSSKSVLLKHIPICQNQVISNARSCDICGSALKVAINSGYEYLKCESCLKVNSYNCNPNNEKFDQTDALKLHPKSDRSEKPFQCDLCKQRFTNLQHLKRHIEVIHNGQTNYQCEYCKKCFRWDSSLRTHLKTHTNERPHQCPSCSFSFRRSCDLKRHTITHTNEKKYSCEHCDKKFTRNSSLQRHIRAHFGDKPYLCYVCGKRFNESFFLKEHMESHSENRKYYYCDLCNKRFNNRRVLRVHSKKHSRQSTGETDSSNVTKDIFLSCENEFTHNVTNLSHFNSFSFVNDV